MDPIPSAEWGIEYDAKARQALLGIARGAIQHGVTCGGPPRIALDELAEELRAWRACFVTLTRGGRLRGCIGSLEARRPLAEDVSSNAFDTAFSDPRFAAVTARELTEVDIEISVLSLLQPVVVASEAELLQLLRPHVDGLILEDGSRRATFLPKVWSSLAQPEQFVAELKRKAGMHPDHWSDAMRVHRYHTETFSERDRLPV
jgi:AmmeMemoRadiSam system protein A